MQDSTVANDVPDLRMARSQARDGWLFFGLGHLGLLVAALLLILPFKRTGPEDPAAAGLGVSVAFWMIVTSAGFIKFFLAWKDGLQTTGMAWAIRITCVYSIVLALAASVALPLYGDAKAYASVIFAIVLWVIFERRQPKPRNTPTNSSLIALAWMLLGNMLLVYAISVILMEEKGSLLWIENFLKLLWTGYRIRFFTAPSFATCLLVWFFLNYMGIRRLLLADGEPLNHVVTRWAYRCAGLFLVGVVNLLLCLYDFESEATFAASLTIAPTLLLACFIGHWLAKVWFKNRISKLSTALFALPFAFVMLAIFMPTAAIFGSIKSSGSIKNDWCWKIPEVIAGPIGKSMGTLFPEWKVKACLYHSGLMPVADLKADALNSKSGFLGPAWNGWRQRDAQGALQAALAIPTTTNPDIASTSYDYSAGQVIGWYASDEIIRDRLVGSYSHILTDGIMLGLWQRPRLPPVGYFLRYLIIMC